MAANPQLRRIRAWRRQRCARSLSVAALLALHGAPTVAQDVYSSGDNRLDRPSAPLRGGMHYDEGFDSSSDQRRMTDPECGGTHRSYYDRRYGSTAVVLPVEEAQRIDHGDLASQFIQALAQDLTTNVVGVDQDPRAHGERLARRLCTYAGLWSARARGSRGAAPAGNPMQRPPTPHRSLPAPVNPRAVMRESAGADVWAGNYHLDPVTGDRYRVIGVSRVPRSHATSTAANKGEGLAYHEALQRGEIGLQQPAGANLRGTDFITAVLDDAGNVSNVAISEIKTRVRGRFPKPMTAIPSTWQGELLDAISPDRLDLGDQALEGAIRDAVAQGRVVLRQINVDLSPTGQGTISGF